MHLHCKKKVDKEEGARLSAMYKALSDEERAKLREIADLGLAISKSTGENSFGKRRRASSTPTLQQGTRTLHPSIMDGGDSDDEAEGRSQVLDQTLRGSPYMRDAMAARRAALAVKKVKREEDAGRQAALADSSRGALPSSWTPTVIPESSPHTAPLARVKQDEFSLVHTRVPCAVYAAQVTPARIDELVSGKTEELAQRWKDKHIGIMHDVQPKIEAPPPKRERCQEAQQCVCTGAAKSKAKCELKFKGSFKDAVSALGGKVFDKKLDEGRVLCKLSWETAEDSMSGRGEILTLPPDHHKQLISTIYAQSLDMLGGGTVF